MSTFTFKVTLHSLKLKVKFPCQVSLTLKHRGKEYPIIQNEPLTDGNLAAASTSINKLESDGKEGSLEQRQQVVLVLHLQSSHGKLQIGSFSYKLSQIEGPKKVTEKIRNSPDKEAEINLTLEIKYDKNQKYLPFSHKTSQNKSTLLNATQSSRLQSLTLPSTSKWSNYPRKTDSNEKEELPINSGSTEHSNAEVSPYYTFQKQKQGFFQIPQAKPQVSMNYHFQSLKSSRKDSPDFHAQSFDRIQALKRRLSEHKISKPEIVPQNPTNLVEKITALHRENRVSSEQVNNLQLQLRLKESTIKFIEKELENKKSKNDMLQAELREINKALMASQHKGHQLQYSLKKVSEQLEECKQQKEIWSNRSKKNQENLKLQLKHSTEKYYEVNKEKEKLSFKVDSLQTKIQQRERNFQQQLRDKQKASNQQKLLFQKKLASLEKQIYQARAENSNLKTSLQLLNKKLAQTKEFTSNYECQNMGLKSREQQLMQEIKGLYSTKQILSQSLQEEKRLSSQVIKLQHFAEEKDEEIAHMKQYTAKIEAQLGQCEEKMGQLQQSLQKLEHQYEKLYYEKAEDSEELLKKSKTIEQLVESHESLQKKIESLKIIINNQEIEHNEVCNQLEEKLKQQNSSLQKIQLTLNQTLDELRDEIRKKRQIQQQALEWKKKSQEQRQKIEALQDQNQALNNKVIHLKAFGEMSDDKNQHLIKKFEIILNQKNQTEKQGRRKLQRIESEMHFKEQQNQLLKANAQKDSKVLAQLYKKVEENSILLDDKEKRIQELSDLLKKLTYQLQQATETSFSQARTNSQLKLNIIQLTAKIEQLQKLIQQANSQMQEIDQMLQAQTSILAESTKQKPSQSKTLRKLVERMEVKEKQYLSQQSQIQKLSSYLELKQEQQKKLNQLLTQSKKHIQQLQEQLKKSQSHFEETVSLLQEKFHNFEDNPSDTILLTQRANSTKGQMINDLTQAIQRLKTQQKQLKLALHQSETKASQLKQQLNTIKLSQVQVMKKKLQLEQQLDKIKASQLDYENQVTTLKDTVKDLKQQVFMLEASLQEQTKKKSNFQEIVKQKQQIISQLQQQRQTQHQLIEQMESNMNAIQMDLTKKIESLRLQVSEKTKELTLSENQKRQRVQILNRTIEEVKKQNSDLQALVYSEKNNNLKLHSLFVDLANALAKIQKAHNIKTYSMAPIKDLMSSFQQLIKISSKVYSEYEKKTAKKEEKALKTQNGAQSDQKTRLKRLNSRQK